MLPQISNYREHKIISKQEKATDLNMCTVSRYMIIFAFKAVERNTAHNLPVSHNGFRKAPAWTFHRVFRIKGNKLVYNLWAFIPLEK